MQVGGSESEGVHDRKKIYASLYFTFSFSKEKRHAKKLITAQIYK